MDRADTDVLVVALGRQIAAERTALGMSQADLAERTGISPKSIYRYEKGQRDPRVEEVRTIAAVFSMRASELMEAAERRASRNGS